jgi:hypothetical protein
MRGGIRQGAGRKPSESTVRVSVPVGVLGAVNHLISTYKQGVMNNCPIINDDALNDCQEFKQTDFLIECQEIKQDKSLLDSQSINVEKAAYTAPEIIEARKGLERLNSRTRKFLRKEFGSLFKAAELGVRAQPDGGIWVPEDIEFQKFQGGRCA